MPLVTFTSQRRGALPTVRGTAPATTPPGGPVRGPLPTPEDTPMPTADRDQPLPVPGDPSADDTSLHDLADLWTDLGGSD